MLSLFFLSSLVLFAFMNLLSCYSFHAIQWILILSYLMGLTSLLGNACHPWVVTNTVRLKMRAISKTYLPLTKYRNAPKKWRRKTKQRHKSKHSRKDVRLLTIQIYKRQRYKPFETKTAIKCEWIVLLSLLEIPKVSWMRQTPSSSDETCLTLTQ